MFLHHKRFLSSPLVLTVVIVLAVSGAARASTPEPRTTAFQARLSTLRLEFADKVSRTNDQEELCALALIYVGKIWAASTIALAERSRSLQTLAQMEQAEQDFKRDLKKNRRPEDKQLAALRLLYRSAAETALVLASRRNDKAAVDEIKNFEATVQKNILAARGSRFQSMVALSQGALGILALTGRSISGKVQPFLLIEQEVKKVMEKGREIEQRKDIHARGKLFLIAVNNLVGCFKLVCLLGLAMDEASFPEIEAIRKSWQKNTGQGTSPARTWAVTLTALAEASFPLASALNPD
ncbi:MAG: hypothetical protein V1816_02490 [Pseudomonadota bacterium]